MTHKANWCLGIVKMMCGKVFLVRKLISSLMVTNKAKMESTSAEWMFQATTWRSCLFALVKLNLV